MENLSGALEFLRVDKNVTGVNNRSKKQLDFIRAEASGTEIGETLGFENSPRRCSSLRRASQMAQRISYSSCDKSAVNVSDTKFSWRASWEFDRY